MTDYKAITEATVNMLCDVAGAINTVPIIIETFNKIQVALSAYEKLIGATRL